MGLGTPFFYPSKSNNDAIKTIPAPNNDKILGFRVKYVPAECYNTLCVMHMLYLIVL